MGKVKELFTGWWDDHPELADWDEASEAVDSWLTMADTVDEQDTTYDNKED